MTMMDFAVLIDDHFLKLVGSTDLDKKRKHVLSIVNDYEDDAWRIQKFEDFVWNNIALTALSAQERDKLTGQSRSLLREAAKNLRLTDNVNDFGKGSELAEVVLYGIMQHHYGALPVVPKIFYKQNTQDNAKGADSVHIVLEGNADFSLWFGEAKFYNSIEDARLPAIIESVGNSLRTDKLKKENSVITNTSDLSLLVKDPKLLEKIKDALATRHSIDAIKPKIHVPILMLHECSITKTATQFDAAYIDQIKTYHLARATTYFNKQIAALSGSVSKYLDVTFHVILFPVPDRKELIKRFTEEASLQKGK
jgi:Cap4 SAVED domain